MAQTLVLATLGGSLLGGCGGGTKTVTVAAAPRASGASTGTSGATSSSPAANAAHPASTSTTTSGTSEREASSTRTAPAPAFVEHARTGGAEEAPGTETAAAVAIVKAHGYTPNDASEYHPNQTLRVLLGTRAGSADGYDQRAFFFLSGRYIGTDASQPSASLRVLSQSDTEVVLAYALYRPHDSLCCPGGGEATVHFALNDGKLVPLQPIPTASPTAALSRQ